MNGIFDTAVNAFSVQSLRKRLLYTFMILGLFMLGGLVPVPAIDGAKFTSILQTWGQLGSIMDLSFMAKISIDVQYFGYSSRSMYSQAASVATAPSEAAVVSWRTAFVRQSPAVKIPGVRVRQSSPAAI